jgi:hypothetical protein
LSRAVALELQTFRSTDRGVETAALCMMLDKIHGNLRPAAQGSMVLRTKKTALMQTHAAKSAELVADHLEIRGRIPNQSAPS